MLSATALRWWTVTPSQIHSVGLHMRYGRELLAEAGADPAVRAQVIDSLSQLAAPVRAAEIRNLLSRGAVKEAVERSTPSELFLLAQDLAPKLTGDNSYLRAELLRLAAASPLELSDAAISRAFGTPKPTLANSY